MRVGIVHGETGPQKPIAEMAKYMKNLLSTHIPETYVLKPMVKSTADEAGIRRGVVALRDFLLVFCDRLISDGAEYSPPQKKPRHPTHYPFLNYIESLLLDIGCRGTLSADGEALLLGATSERTIPISRQAGCLRFLTLCGFAFEGGKGQPTVVSYPKDPTLLTRLKAMAIMNAQPRGDSGDSGDSGDRWRNGWRNGDVLLRCDYRILKEEATDEGEVLRDFLHPLPEKVREFAMGLHRQQVDRGMTCRSFLCLSDLYFVYADTRRSKQLLSAKDVYQKRTWEFALCPKDGYCLAIRSKRMERYADVIEAFPPRLREMIARGYGCDRKLRNEPCQGGCRGFRIPLDESILGIDKEIETWLDHEIL